MSHNELKYNAVATNFLSTAALNSSLFSPENLFNIIQMSVCVCVLIENFSRYFERDFIHGRIINEL